MKRVTVATDILITVIVQELCESRLGRLGLP